MNVDKFGLIELSEQDALDLLYNHKNINFQNFYFDRDTVDKFNSILNKNKDPFDELKLYQQPSVTVEEFDLINQKQWFIPKDYCPTLINDLYAMCITEEQTNRLTTELELYHKHNMIDVLFFLKYLVDTMRKNNIVWGVGRGSSVASYVLFLIGVHKIDSVKYNLDINEFLK